MAQVRWHTLAEITTWTVEDTEAALQQVLPLGWEFRYDVGAEQQYFGYIFDSARELRWHLETFDLSLLLLSVYGWFYLRSHPEAKAGPWVVRQQELTNEIVQKHALSVPDPEDLVPEELEAFYHLNKDSKNAS